MPDRTRVNAAESARPLGGVYRPKIDAFALNTMKAEH